MEKIRYLKFKSAQLKYNFFFKNAPKKDPLNLTFYLSAENIFTWTNYSGPDPESVDIMTGIDDLNNYPLAHKFTIGCTIHF